MRCFRLAALPRDTASRQGDRGDRASYCPVSIAIHVSAAQLMSIASGGGATRRQRWMSVSCCRLSVRIACIIRVSIEGRFGMPCIARKRNQEQWSFH